MIDGDEWLGTALARALVERGYSVDSCTEARAGFDRACTTLPDCVLSAVDLPDIDGFWVARRIRTEGGTVARTPIILLTDIDDKAVHVQGLQVGADVLLMRPISNEQVVAQVDALVAMARRYARPEAAEENSAPSLAAAFRGDLSSFPIASILMMLEMERRTGVLEVIASSKKRARLVVSSGFFGKTELGGEPSPALDVLREVLGWRAGRFAFRPGDAGSMPPPTGTVGAIVLEAMRLEDERKRVARS